MKLILSLSHGQDDVERGFSVNKQLVAENQKESLNAGRLFNDHLKDIGGVCHAKIMKDMLAFARSAR